MKYAFFAAVLLMFACNSAAERKPGTGIYFVEEKKSGGTFTIYARDSSVYFLDTNAALTENDFLNLTYYSIRDTFELELTDKGSERYKFLRYRSGGKQAAVVVAGKLIGLFVIPQDMHAYKLETALLADIGWTRKMSDSLNREWQMREDTLPKPPGNGAWKDHYASGKLYEEGEYKDGIPLWKKGYFESGTLVYEMADSGFVTPFGSFFREYHPNGNMMWEEFTSFNYSNVDSTRSYYPDGTLASAYTFSPDSGNGHIVHRTFTETGAPDYEEHAVLLDGLPGVFGKGNNPQVVAVRRYSSGKLSAEGQLYREGPDQRGDSTGVWTFHTENPPRVTRFPSWKNLYARSVAKALAEQRE